MVVCFRMRVKGNEAVNSFLNNSTLVRAHNPVLDLRFGESVKKYQRTNCLSAQSGNA
jgi:hypothetical protein